MNWRNTWLLVGVAAALFAFIYLYERHLDPHATEAPVPALLADARATDATEVSLRRGTQFVISLERTNGAWHYTKPLYPADSLRVQGFLQELERLVPATYITAQEILARKQTSADFGFDAPPTVVISLQTPSGRKELKFGARTPAGDQVYVEVVGKPGIYVVSSEIWDRLPRTEYDWRDTIIFNFDPQKLDRAEVVLPGSGGFALQRDPTNKLWRLTRPSHRADQFAVEQLVRRIEGTRVLDFVTDNPRDLEPFGLQTPQAELVLGVGRSTQRLQIGRNPTNDPGRVYARLMNTSNVVLVAGSIVDVIAVPYTQLRDRRLLAFAPELIDLVEVKAEESFVLRKQGNVWTVGDAAVDSAFVNDQLAALSNIEVTEFAKDVVTDFAPYALAPPLKDYTLRVTITNAAGPTNLLVGQVSFGTNQNGVFARRWDEASVYSIRLQDYVRLPGAAWQLRDHRVWSFTTNQITRVTVSQGGHARQLLRQPGGEWALAPGSTGEINPFALEETMFRLGELHADAWVARGEAAWAGMGFSTNSYQIAVELKEGEKTRTVAIQFAGMSHLRFPYAATVLDGQPWVFEFPWSLYVDVQRYLPPPVNAARAGAAGL